MKNNPSVIRTPKPKQTDAPPILPLSARPDFIPLPADLKDLTDEQVNAVFGGDMQGVLREILRLGLGRSKPLPPESAGVA